MIHLLLLDLLPTEQFAITWDLMGEIATDGTTHCLELAQNEYYKKAVATWVEAKKAHRQRFTEGSLQKEIMPLTGLELKIIDEYGYPLKG